MALVGWQHGMDLGFGFDRLQRDPRQQAVEGRAATVERAGGEEGEFGIALVTSAEEFDEAVNIEASAQAGVGLVGGGGKLGFKMKCKVSSQATFCVVRALATHSYVQLHQPKLAPDAWRLLEARNATRFRERFGDQFVGGMLTGVEFYGVVRIEASEVRRQREIAGKVQASYGFFTKGGAATQFDEAMASETQSIEIITYQKGGVTAVAGSLDEMFAAARDALARGRAGQGYAFAASLDAYTELERPNDDASFVDVEFATRTLERLGRSTAALRNLQNDIDFVLRNQRWFEQVDVSALNAASAEITAELNALRDRAAECARDVTACKDYAPRFPAVTLPTRRDGQPALAPPPAGERDAGAANPLAGGAPPGGAIVDRASQRPVSDAIRFRRPV